MLYVKIVSIARRVAATVFSVDRDSKLLSMCLWTGLDYTLTPFPGWEEEEDTNIS